MSYRDNSLKKAYADPEEKQQQRQNSARKAGRNAALSQMEEDILNKNQSYMGDRNAALMAKEEEMLKGGGDAAAEKYQMMMQQERPMDHGDPNQQHYHHGHDMTDEDMLAKGMSPGVGMGVGAGIPEKQDYGGHHQHMDIPPDSKDPFLPPESAPMNGMGYGGDNYGQHDVYPGAVFGQDIATPGIEAFVADQPIDATGVAVVMSEEEEEQLEEKKQRRYLIYGFICFIISAAIVVISVVLTVGRSPPPEPLVPTTMPSSSPSQVPSFSPTTNRLDAFVNQFIPVSGEEVFQDRDSPQFRAAEWVADLDELQLEVGDPRAMQRYILACFYFALEGDGWVQCGRTDPTCGGDPDDDAWLSHKNHECTWLGVSCTEGNTGNVKMIFFARQLGNGLNGTLPPELTALPDLEELVMQRNNIYGTIPTFLGEISKLLNLFFFGNKFTGTLPASILTKATLLGTIHFGENLLNGSIPTEVGQLPLRLLNLDENAFTGTIPTEFGMNTQLTHLEIQQNDLTGSIPDELYQATSLNRLRLFENRLTGTISPLISNLQNLEDLRIGDNQFVGQLPIELFELPGPVDVRVENNTFTGTIPTIVGNLNETLRRLYLNDNNMNGPIPIDAIHRLTYLNALILHGNEFTGTITEQVCDEKGSRFFDLRNLTVPPSVDCSVRRGCCNLVL